MVNRRRARSTLGCLFALLLAVAVVYFGFDIAEVYWRYYQFDDAVSQETHFGTTRSDAEIKSRLRALADSLGLPEEAGRIQVQRSANRLVVSTSYTEQVKLPFHTRDFRFAPRAEVSY
ncbi:MAG: hypothetical protein ACT4R6_07500 [Gemmatimonadaceae bacterium]